MLQNQRHERILRQLELNHAVKVAELAKDLNITEKQVNTVLELLGEGNTVPFIFHI